ncbi:MAG: type IX secretion system outer membrane channel protein PorV [Bacteroidales bacterium]|nr:type IX secretion system outer membrane channel protein PorV [Bacteroidales bacterium]
MKTRFFLLFVLAGMFTGLQGQTIGEVSGQGTTGNVIRTAVPFMMIGPDARAGGMGDGGVATSPDAYSMHWNAAKYAFITENDGFSISYTPWLKNLVNDINLAYLTYFHRLNDQSALAFSLRYFSLGDITFTDQMGNPVGVYKPNEFAIDGAYARKLSDYLSLAVTGKFIYSNLTAGYSAQGVDNTAGYSVAVDVGLYWEKDVNWFPSMDAQFAWGLQISNIGKKVSYSHSNIQKDFIPTNLRFGPRLTLNLDQYNKLSFNLDINKLLVPTPPIYATDSTGSPLINPDGTYVIAKGMNPDVSVVKGIFQSFYDAPGGFKEEMQEFYLSFGAEYWYNNVFALRGGYFYENKYKGDRQYVTLGLGLRYNVFGIDFSYLIPTVTQQNPLEKTLRFSLVFNFGNNTNSSNF